MESSEHPKPEYPLLLKALLAIGALFLGSLGLLLMSIILSMWGFAYHFDDLIVASRVIEQLGIVMLGLSVVVGGGVSMMGMATRAFTMPDRQTEEAEEKQKNENRLYDIRDEGLTVEEVLGDMSRHERELLAEKLAESRLAIREDGTLIPLEQAEKLYKIERIING